MKPLNIARPSWPGVGFALIPKRTSVHYVTLRYSEESGTLEFRAGPLGVPRGDNNFVVLLR